MAVQHICTDVRRTCFRTEAVMRDISGGEKIKSVYTNEADYVPPQWMTEKHSPFVAQLHDLRVQVAESDPLVRELTEGILEGEDKARREIVRMTEALSLAKEIAVQLYVSLEHQSSYRASVESWHASRASGAERAARQRQHRTSRPPLLRTLFQQSHRRFGGQTTGKQASPYTP
jgi:hypothetical protein